MERNEAEANYTILSLCPDRVGWGRRLTGTPSAGWQIWEQRYPRPMAKSGNRLTLKRIPREVCRPSNFRFCPRSQTGDRESHSGSLNSVYANAQRIAHAIHFGYGSRCVPEPVTRKKSVWGLSILITSTALRLREKVVRKAVAAAAHRSTERTAADMFCSRNAGIWDPDISEIKPPLKNSPLDRQRLISTSAESRQRRSSVTTSDARHDREGVFGAVHGCSLKPAAVRCRCEPNPARRTTHATTRRELLHHYKTRPSIVFRRRDRQPS